LNLKVMLNYKLLYLILNILFINYTIYGKIVQLHSDTLFPFWKEAAEYHEIQISFSIRI
jgi:hypothetical protein